MLSRVGPSSSEPEQEWHSFSFGEKMSRISLSAWRKNCAIPARDLCNLHILLCWHPYSRHRRNHDSLVSDTRLGIEPYLISIWFSRLIPIRRSPPGFCLALCNPSRLYRFRYEPRFLNLMHRQDLVFPNLSACPRALLLTWQEILPHIPSHPVLRLIEVLKHALTPVVTQQRKTIAAVAPPTFAARPFT